MKYIIKLLLILSFSSAAAQNTSLSMWHLEPHNSRGVSGIGFQKAEELMKLRTPDTLIVAVIDAGVDIFHPDLRDHIWINPNEQVNGLDDDGNGYIDDINGWNFIGTTTYDNLELTREYVRLNALYESPTADTSNIEFTYYLQLKEKFLAKYEQSEFMFSIFNEVLEGISILERRYGEDIGPQILEDSKSTCRAEELARMGMSAMFQENPGIDYSTIRSIYQETYNEAAKDKEFWYNPYFKGRDSTVGDNTHDVNERYYGNNTVYHSKAFSEHGTHVAGIIAADASDNEGAKGVCDHCLILPIRAVPDGDERDKDVANSIRYAVDNGAKIINMSFGKSYSPHRNLVEEAVAYGQAKGVLFVHAAGNDGLNIDENDNFPNDYNSKYGSNWIEVGAHSPQSAPHRIAPFSNYGKQSVDLFAPGVSIYSTLCENDYGELNGTSMAAPVVAGVAAYVWSYYPELSAAELKDILLTSAQTIKGRQRVPGKFFKQKAKRISRTGGSINLYEALLEAEKRRN